MREILFRGKLKTNNKWSYGNLVINRYDVALITPDETPLGTYGAIDKDTVGQYTGLLDKNGKKIFEGDKIKGLFYQERSIIGTVDFQKGAFGIKWLRGDVEEFEPFTSICNVEYEVVV